MIARLLVHPLSYLVIIAVGISLVCYFDSPTPPAPTSHVSLPTRATPRPQRPTASASPSVASTASTATPTGDLFAQTLALSQHSAPSERVRLAQALAALGPGSIDIIARSFSQATSPLGKGACADALALIGTSEAIDHYVALIRSATSDATSLDILDTSLAALSNSEGIDTLASALTLIDDPAASAVVARHTGRLASPSTAAFLLEMWDEPASIASQRDNLATAIASLSNPEAAAPLIAVTESMGDAQLQAATAAAYARIGTPAALDSLVSLILRQEPQPTPHRQALLQQLTQVTNPEAKVQLQALVSAPLLPSDLRQAAKAALQVLESRG